MRKLLYLLMLLFLPAIALGEIHVETISEAGGKLATNRYTFEDEMPPVVMDQLSMHGCQDVHCVSGLALERLVLEYPEGQENAYRSSDALLITEKDGVYSLIGMRWHFADQKGWLGEYGSLGLALDQPFHLRFEPAALQTVDFVLTAECNAAVRTWRMNVTGQNVWYIASCETPGGETVRWSEFDGGFELEDGLHWACWWPQLERMRSFAEYPATAAQAVQLAESSWAGLPLDRLVVIGGNLREKPTGKSRSFGMARGHVLGEVLDQRMGVYEPWYQVRVGHTVGWVSGAYVHFLTEENGKGLGGLLRPLDVAVVRESIPLRYSLDDHTAVMTLNAGTRLQVLAQTGEDWLHVVVPTARATRCMDMNGVYGYVKLDEVELQD